MLYNSVYRISIDRDIQAIYLNVRYTELGTKKNKLHRGDNSSINRLGHFNLG